MEDKKKDIFRAFWRRREGEREQRRRRRAEEGGAGMREMRGTQQTHKSYIYPNEVKSLTGNKRCEQRQDPERIAVWVQFN